MRAVYRGTKILLLLPLLMILLLWKTALYAVAYTSLTTYFIHSPQDPGPLPNPRMSAKSISALRAMTPPTIDGNISEWEAAGVPALDFNAYTSDTVAGPWPSYSDFRAFVYVAWDAQYLYVAARIYDESIWTDSSTLWQDDEIEVAFDGQNDSVGWQWDDHQVTIAADGRAADFGTRPSVVESAVYRYSDGWGVEFRIAWSKLIASSPYAGRVVGFNLGYNDDDDGGYRETHLVWSGNSTTNSQGYGQLRLSGTTVYLSQRPPTLTPTPTPTMTPTPTPAAYPDSYEPDNSCANARWIYLDAPQRHNFHRVDDVDWVKFTVVAGATYVIETYDLESNADTVLDLYTNDCTARLATDDDGGPGRGSRIEWRPTASGTYKVKVRPFSGTNTGSYSGYTIKITQTHPPPPGKVAIPLVMQGDITPPVIHTVWKERDLVYAMGCSSATTTRIRVDAWDSGTRLAWVRLYYRMEGEVTWQVHNMNYLSGTTYEATLGPFPIQGQVEYFVWARDAAGNDRKTDVYTLHVQRCVSTHYSPVDVVFAVDTSGSMSDEWFSLCSQISGIVSDLQREGIAARYDILGIDTPFEATGSYTCTGGRTVRSVISESTVDQYEDWGPAIIDLATKYSWRQGSIRVVIPISDEGPQNGDPVDDADRAIILQAIETALQNKVIVYPILGNNASSEVVQVAASVAYHTGGILAQFEQGNMRRLVSNALLRAASYCGRYEPNDDRRVNPWGPLHMGVEYEAFLCQGDWEDNYFLDMGGSARLVPGVPDPPVPVKFEISWPSVFVGRAAVWIYDSNDLQADAYVCSKAPIGSIHTELTCQLYMGRRYIIRMYADNPSVVYDNDTPYRLKVTTP